MPKSRYSLMFPSWYPNRENPLSGIFTKKHISAIDQFIPTYTLFVLPTDKIKPLRIEKEKTEKEEIIYFGTTTISVINAVLFISIYSFSILFMLSLKRFGFEELYLLLFWSDLTYGEVSFFLVHCFLGRICQNSYGH